MRSGRARQTSKTNADLQFQALATLNEKLSEQIREKDLQMKETHRSLLVEIDASKKLEKEVIRLRTEKDQCFT